MKLPDIILTRKARHFTILLLSVAVIYFILRFFILGYDPVLPCLKSFFDSYLLLAEKISNRLLHLAGCSVIIDHQLIVLNNNQLDGFIPVIRFVNWMVLILLGVWLTKTSIARRFMFTLLLVLVHLLGNSIYLAIGANLAALQEPDSWLLAVTATLILLILVTIFFLWYRNHKETLTGSLSKLKLNSKLFENDFRLIVIIYIFIILIYFLKEAFDYSLWIGFLFKSAQRILALLGYNATVESSQLIGANGYISMTKDCLGIATMYLFAVMVFLTGNNNKLRWIYIIAGLIFLNFVNIMRFVFLFINIQNHEIYFLAMDVHDMYDIITYAIIFILWVIWFERFADVGSPRKEQSVERRA
jgi:exosortase/archaeosortase family protein